LPLIHRAQTIHQNELRALRAAFNDFALQNVSPGEIQALHDDVNRVQEQNREIKTRIATLERLFCRARRAAMTAAKALSVRQPFADLIARGIKPIENRSWRTRYRGLIYIHVARLPHRMPREEIETVFGVTLEAERVRRDRRPRRACRYCPKFLVALVSRPLRLGL
jgi:hypothetical protein